ncbi:MAG: adenylosuccinate synthase [SAR324 cluster bacterium]|nr:adenylosuccinate synthase [SAR324 cluster bacterium]
MPGVVVVGSQWGDEGKGKVVDFLTERADVVARYQGGNNAGHTVMFGDRKFVLHLLPSGIFRENKRVVLGEGVVIDPEALLEELDALSAQGVEVGDRLYISDAANLVMPYHKAFDKLREQWRGAGKIGTTGRGIGPTYEDKNARRGVRFCDFRPGYEAIFCARLKEILEEKNVLLRSHYRSDEALFDAEEICERYAVFYERVKPYLCDTSVLLNEALDAGQTVLFEGAQGTMLDVDHGTYPYVTSSNTISGGACTGCGVGPTKISRVIGITKAYTTRVGEGPFPTELKEGPVAAMLQDRGQEFGATTGRPRRCGWFDAMVVRHAARLNGLTDLAIMKVDVLDTLQTIRICVGYRDQQGNQYDTIPHWLGNYGGLEPVYEEMPGWNEPIDGITELKKLPQAARDYLQRLSELVGVPTLLVSTGPRREETIMLGDI